MRVLFVVNHPKTLRPTYTTAYLALAAKRRGHQVAFISVDDLAHEREVTGRVVKLAPGKYADTSAMVASLKGSQAVRVEVPLAGFDVVLLRNNPHLGDGHSAGFPHGDPPKDPHHLLAQSGASLLA